MTVKEIQGRHCRLWDMKEGAKPGPFQDAVTKNCGNCKYFRSDQPHWCINIDKMKL